jgi:heme exporter protein CcmD
MKEFLDMGGYGAYVWTCYGATLAVLIGNILAARRRLHLELEKARRRAHALEVDR